MSKKFTGITSAGSAIPVYDKDAHSAIAQKLDTSVFNSYSSTHSADDNTPYSAGSNIEIENHVISVVGQLGKIYSGENGVTVDNENDKIGLDASALSAIEAYQGEYNLSAGNNITFRTEDRTVFIDSDVESAISGKQDISGMTAYQPVGEYYSASNPSGFITGVDLTPYQEKSAMTAFQTIEGMSAYQPSGDYQAAGDYLSASESANFYPMSGNPSGFLTEHQSLAGLMQTSGLEYDGDKISGYMGSAFKAGDELPSGVMVESAVEYNAVNEISGYNGSAIAQYGAEKQWLVHDDTLVHAANSAQYALGVNVSAVQTLIGLDETVLFSGDLTGNGATAALNESKNNFDRIKIYGHTDDGLFCGWSTEVINVTGNSLDLGVAANNAGWGKWFNFILDDEKITNVTGRVITFGTSTWGTLSNWGITRVIGIGRKS